MENKMLTGRRGFLKGAAVGAVAAGFGGLSTSASFAQSAAAGAGSGLMAHPIVSGDPKSDAFWADVRKAFPLSDNYIHMNTGTTGSVPLFAQNNLTVYNAYKSLDPKDWSANLLRDFPELYPVAEGGTDSIKARQAAIAKMYGANEDEIVLSYNTSDGFTQIVSGIPWKEGDRVVVTNMEHGGMMNVLNWARDYRGVEIVTVNLPSNFVDTITADEVASWFEPELAKGVPDGNVQYLAISEIPYKNGVRLPIRKLTDLARAHGAYSMVDSAHAWGMLPVNCHEYGADFIAGAGHKWLCGGPGTGIMYVRNHGDNLPPFAVGNFRGYSAAHFNNRDWSPAGVMQGRGEYNRTALLAMADTAAFFDHVGLQNIYARGVELGDYLKDKIADRWGKAALVVQKNADPEFATFLTAFNPFAARDDNAEYGVMNDALTAVIGELSAGTDPKVYIRTSTWRDGESDADSAAADRTSLRISTHAMYNNKAEIDTMFDIMAAAIDKTGVKQLS